LKIGNCALKIVLITGKSFTGKFAIIFFTVIGKNVTVIFKGLKLDYFTRFYLKFAGKTAFLVLNCSVFLIRQIQNTTDKKNCNLAVKTALFP
jgi:hypothetical protein